MGTPLAELLAHYLANRGWSFERLAKEAGLPRNTVYRWTRGDVRRVRHWQDLANAARTLELSKHQANALLQAGGHSSIEELQKRITDEEDRELLSRWTSTSPNNLPAQLTSFIGRQEELGQIAQMLSTARLVTLTGTGGSGKTRLALAVAQSVLDEFEGVYFVDIAPVRDPELVIPTISETLGLSESLDEPPLRSLETYLRDRSVLLVLDNFEQAIEAAPLVTQILGTAPTVKALVTSRMRLNVRGEQEFPVLPLSLPNRGARFVELTLNPSVALFSDRARTVNPTFTLTPCNVPHIAEVCTHLDGLPLGIELAAAKTRHVRLSSMLERFPRRLALASGGPRDVPDRQRTLRTTIAWSYDLLDPEQQRLLNCLGVFAGGFTEEAAGSVCAAIEQVAIDASEGLETLVEQNLIRRIWDEAGGPRYEMLESIREYALERLGECGIAEVVSSAFSAYFTALAERADLEGAGQAYWSNRLVAEHANFRAALGWCREQGQIETGLRLSIALMPLWLLRDHLLEARTWLETFMANEAPVPAGLRARGMLWHGLLLLRTSGDTISASCLFEDALALFREDRDLNGMSEALQAEADVDRNHGAWKCARQRYAESLALAERTGHAHLVAHGWMGLAFCAQEEGEFEDAQRYWELTLEWAERAENGGTTALALNSLGEMARYRGDWQEAEHYYESTLTLAKELGSEFRMALALHNLGYVALYEEDLERAKRRFTDGLLLYAGRQYRKGVAECLAGLGRVEASMGRLERAASLCGAAGEILERLGTRLDTLDRADYEGTLETLKSELGERLETLLDAGRAMSMEKAVKHALADRCSES